MKIYLSVSQIPELALFNSSEQRLMEAIILKKISERSRWIPRLPVLMSVIMGTGGWFVFPLIGMSMHWLRGLCANTVSLCALYAGIGMVAGGMLGGFIGNQVVIKRVRSFLHNPDA